MSDLIPFQYEGRQVRTIDKDGEPWFVLRDVCEILELTNSRMVADRLDGDEVSQTYIADALGRQQETTIINESGLYNVILRSDKPEAKQFRKWVTSEVLPTIRKHGAYVTTDKLEAIMNDPDSWITMLNALKKERTEKEQLRIQTEADRPKVLFADSVAGSSGGILVRDMAKILCQNGFDIGEKRFYAWLREHGYVIKNDGRDKNMPTQKSMELKIMDIREGTRINAEGVSKPIATTLVTGKGQIYFVNKFRASEQRGA